MVDYTGLNILELLDLNYYDYLLLRRDAFIYWLSQSQAGLEYLDKAWVFEQTEPDRAALRAAFGRKG